MNSVKGFFCKIGKGFAAFGRFVNSLYAAHPLIFCIVTSFLLEFYIEAFSRHNFIAGVKFIFTSPVIFFYNMLVVFGTMAISLILKKGIAMWTTAFVVWFGFGTANAIILLNRPSPFTGSDFLILPSVLEIITIYLKIYQIIIICVGIVAAITGVVFLWIKCPKRKLDLKKDIASFAVTAALLGILTPTFISADILSSEYGNIYNAYYENGFPYSFCRSVFCKGIPEPDEYGKEQVDDVLKLISEKKEESGDVDTFTTPNVIFVQLESFFDLTEVEGLTISEDPIPNFRKLKETCPTGFMSVPLMGSGTANTEFEVLTGMNIDYFSPGEYPFINILRDTVCQSAATVFGDMGYSTHTMHNNTGTFYDRNLVYPNLGFDSFTPVEYMYDIELNPLNWAKDMVLIDEIDKCLTSTEERDFVFTVSVQAHGQYPTSQAGNYRISVSGPAVEAEEQFHRFSYYVNQVYESDQFVGKLIEKYASYEEPTVIMFYGDHLPDLKLTEDMLSHGDLYQSEYVMWSNFGLFDGNNERTDLEAYQLSARLFGLMGLTDGAGLMVDAHRYLCGEENYQEYLHIIEYDALYGEKYCYRGNVPEKTDMRFGMSDVTVSGIERVGGDLIVSGTNFNKYSTINIDGKSYKTELLPDGRLKAEKVKLYEGSMVSVSQQATDGTNFAFSNSFAYNG